MKILVPVDGSAYSLKAVEMACDLAKAHAPSTVVLTAVAIQIPNLEEGVYIAEKMKALAEIALAKAKEVAQAKGIDAEVILGTGASPADEIVQAAKDQQGRPHRHRQPGPGGQDQVLPGQHRLPGGNLLSLLGPGGQDPGLSEPIAPSLPDRAAPLGPPVLLEKVAGCPRPEKGWLLPAILIILALHGLGELDRPRRRQAAQFLYSVRPAHHLTAYRR